MPTKSELHFMLESDLEFGLNSASDLGSEHANHVSTTRKKISSNKGKVVGKHSMDENKKLRFTVSENLNDNSSESKEPSQQKLGGPQ